MEPEHGPEHGPEHEPEHGPADASFEPGPPPPPLGVRPAGRADRASVGPAASERRRPVVRLILVGTLILLAAALGFIGGLAASDLLTVPDMLRSPAALEAEREEQLIGLLEDVVRTEGVMLAFNDEVGERLASPQEESAVLAAIASAATDSVEELRALRPGIVARTGGASVDAVRSVYLPHLDSWIDYLGALAEDPALLFTRDTQQPFILLINATAEAFREVLEELLDEEPSARVAELAERILDDGFRSEGPDPTV